MRSRSGAGALVVAGALLLAARGGGGETKSGSAGATSSSGDSIMISNFMFDHMSTTVSPGATVSVMNMDSAAHTLTATDGQFNTGDIAQNQTKTFKAPTKPGSYSYICNIHQYMTGMLIVR